MEQTKIKSGPKDVFLHLLSIVTLYSAAVALLSLLFNMINLAFPDPLNSFYYLEAAQDSIRFSVSVLIIVFPAYLLTNWLLGKEYASNPQRREVRIRRWLVYLTLFISALILIGDLVVLVNGLLSGDLAAAFLLKVLSVFVVIGSIFAYYFWDLRRDISDKE